MIENTAWSSALKKEGEGILKWDAGSKSSFGSTAQSSQSIPRHSPGSASGDLTPHTESWSSWDRPDSTPSHFLLSVFHYPIPPACHKDERKDIAPVCGQEPVPYLFKH